jgi:hypothetical protein
MMNDCESCQFFKQDLPLSKVGQCRKQSPGTLTETGYEGIAVWPKVSSDDFCGEHKSKSENRKCGTCQFGDDGICRRHAPVVIQHFGEEWARPCSTQWPEVEGDDFCGEWEKRA